MDNNEIEQGLIFIRMFTKKYPKALKDVIEYASQGALDRIEEEREVSKEVQISLGLLYQFDFSQLNMDNKKRVLEAILTCDNFKNTQFTREIEDKLKEIDSMKKVNV